METVYPLINYDFLLHGSCSTIIMYPNIDLAPYKYTCIYIYIAVQLPERVAPFSFMSPNQGPLKPLVNHSTIVPRGLREAISFAIKKTSTGKQDFEQSEVKKNSA